MDNKQITILVASILAILLVAITYFIFPVRLWIRAKLTGLSVSFIQLCKIQFAGFSPAQVVAFLMDAKFHRWSNIEFAKVEDFIRSSGNISNLSAAMDFAHRNNIDVSFDQLAALELAGRDSLYMLKDISTTKIIQIPIIEAISKDGMQVIVRGNITAKPIPGQIIGGLGEEALISRISHRIVAAIGSSESHKELIENPFKLSQKVLESTNVDGSAYEILSFDISDIDIGKNIFAEVEAENQQYRLQQLEREAQIRELEAKSRKYKDIEDTKEAYFVKVPKPLITPIQQYLLFFKEFVQLSKGEEIFFELKMLDEGIEINISPNDENDKEN